jgi:hypothetical protein
VIIDGDRGSGKSMVLVYYSVTNELSMAGASEKDFDPSNLGIYVPCNNPLLLKSEHHEALEGTSRDIISERYLIYTIAASIAKNLTSLEPKILPEERATLLEEIKYIMPDDTLHNMESPFKYVTRYIRNRLREDQETLADGLNFDFSFETSSFFVLILPLLDAIREVEFFKESHFSFLLDDAHMLDAYQQSIVNSWLGYRDHSIFSLKVAIAGLRNYSLKTAYGGVILDGHDFTHVDLYRPFQNKDSDYGKFAREVVERRLRDIGIRMPAPEFFPPSESFVKDLEKAKKKAEAEALSKGISKGDRKAFNDYRYKYGRAIYFRDRSSKANKPPYSGFETLTHLSTGVVRSLLNLCYTMFERQLSRDQGGKPKHIRPDVQAQVILDSSDKQWELVRRDLDKVINKCTPEDAAKIANLLTRVAEYFRDRLMNHQSEPRVLVFSISGFDRLRDRELAKLLNLAEQAQLLYVRSGVAKSGGGRDDYYVMNRILFPVYGLDVQGQHGRASLKAEDLLAAALYDKSLPGSGDQASALEQGELFDV